ncbi:hypothetical protein CRG98_028124 [Punica granatum]|uniref:TF-B3 domain-containing protein n=1 Tax=Punica granatum TaxID=22663 RepID=A0A2I0J5R7_PUNGR|nr:hypothetical protein CRG98_028124 [Punica granatum]
MAAEIGSNEGMSVTMLDLDTDFKDLMVFKYWWSMEAFVLNKCWIEKFVKRRNVKPNDEIGLIWDPNSMQFYFSVLSRAGRMDMVDEDEIDSSVILMKLLVYQTCE